MSLLRLGTFTHGAADVHTKCQSHKPSANSRLRVPSGLARDRQPRAVDESCQSRREPIYGSGSMGDCRRNRPGLTIPLRGIRVTSTRTPGQEGCMVRRQFLTGVAALGATVLLPRGESEAQMATTQPHRIDVHHHHTPPPYVAAITARNIPGPVRDWTPEKSIADMDRAGVATAITSITTPAMRFLDDAGARKLGRECNDYSAKLAADSKGRFGMFAAMPMPSSTPLFRRSRTPSTRSRRTGSAS